MLQMIPLADAEVLYIYIAEEVLTILLLNSIPATTKGVTPAAKKKYLFQSNSRTTRKLTS